MSITKYCLECRAQVSADEKVCPFCGGVLSESEPEPTPEELPEYAPEGLTKDEFLDGYVAASDRNSIKIWSVGLLIAAVASVLLAGASILEPLFIALFAVCFLLSVAVFILPNPYVTSVVTAVSAVVAVLGYLKSKSVIGLFVVIVGFYLAYSLFRIDVKWRRYRNGEQFEKIKPMQGAPVYKPMNKVKRIIIVAIAVAAFCGAFAFTYITQTKEAAKYENYTVGAADTGNRTYTNDWVGLSFNIPEGYKIAGGDELKTVNKDKGYTDEATQWIAFLAEKDDKNTITVMLHNVATENFTGKAYLQQIDFKDTFDENNCTKLNFGGLEFDAYHYEVNHQYELVLNHYKYAVVVKFSADSEENLKSFMHDFFPEASEFEITAQAEETATEEVTTEAEVKG